MDVRAGSATLAKTRTSTFGGSRPQQRSRAAVDSGPGCQNVIDDNEASSGHGGLAVARDTKGTLDIGGAFGSRQPDLLRGWLDPLERTAATGSPVWRDTAAASIPD